MSRARAWCFTINNPLEVDEMILDDLECEYIVYGRERGESGTPHLQGYVEFANAKTLSAIKKLTTDRIHLEPRRAANPKVAADYCKKDGNFVERGTISQQGKRSDLEEVANMVKTGSTLSEIAETCPVQFIKFHRGIKELKYQLENDRDREVPPTVIWIYGKTGVGKTRFVHDLHETVYIKDSTRWWDGYRHEEAILVDDFDGTWPYRDFLRFTDRYKYQGQTKGGYVKINSPYIYITCDKAPGAFWHGAELEQIKRRITHEFEFQ